MANLNGLTDEQVRWLQRFIDENKGKPVNTVPHPGPPSHPTFAFLGKFDTVPSSNVMPGELAAPNHLIKPLKGPARSDGDDQVLPPIECHYIWGRVTAGFDPWLEVWEYYNYRYVYVLQCSPSGGGGTDPGEEGADPAILGGAL